MSNQNKNISKVRFIEESNSLYLQTPDGNNYFLNLNLVLFQAGIPYTKKSGELVTIEQINEMKSESQKKYLAVIKTNNKNKAQTA